MHKRLILTIIAILAIILIGLMFFDGAEVSEPQARCRDFLTQQEAQRAYESGQTQLDGDKDGVACEHL